MKHGATISPDAMLIFLKQAALEDHWTDAYLGKALGLDLATAKQVAAEMALCWLYRTRSREERDLAQYRCGQQAGSRPFPSVDPR